MKQLNEKPQVANSFATENTSETKTFTSKKSIRCSKIFIKFMFAVFVFGFAATSCNEKNNATEPPELDCCLGIFTFEEYHLNGKWWEEYPWGADWWNNCFECSCNWEYVRTQSNFEVFLDIINNQEELEKHIECEWERIIPTEIDFSKHTLLLFRGETYRGISNVTYELLHISTHHLKLEVDIKLGFTFGDDYWTIPILTNKLCDENIIETIVTEVE